MKILQYLQKVGSPRDVVVIEEEIDPKPVPCDICGKPSIGVIISATNSFDVPMDISKLKPQYRYYCAEHEKMQ